MTTTPEQIAALIGNYTDLKTFFEGERAALQDARADLPGLITKRIYVDVAKLTNGVGTLADPMNDLDDAIESLAEGQHGTIYVLRNATINRRHFVRNSNIAFFGWDAVAGAATLRTISLADEAETDAANVAGITGRGMIGLHFWSIRLTLSTRTLAGGETMTHLNGSGIVNMTLNSVAAVGTGGDVALMAANQAAWIITVIGLTTNEMDGRWFHGIASGTPLTLENTRALNADLLPN